VHACMWCVVQETGSRAWKKEEKEPHTLHDELVLPSMPSTHTPHSTDNTQVKRGTTSTRTSRGSGNFINGSRRGSSKSKLPSVACRTPPLHHLQCCMRPRAVVLKTCAQDCWDEKCLAAFLNYIVAGVCGAACLHRPASLSLVARQTPLTSPTAARLLVSQHLTGLERACLFSAHVCRVSWMHRFVAARVAAL